MVPSGTGFFNSDSVTYFALPRIRAENLLFKAEMYDTTKVLYYKEIAINERLKASRDFWRETSLYLGVGITAILLYRLLVD